MDGITSKRILTALARKLSFDSIRRVNAPHGINGYMLKLIGKTSTYLVTRPIGLANGCYTYFINNSSKWSKMLEALVGNEIEYGYMHKPKRIAVYSVEQLAIDLELEGFLKRI